MNRSLLLAVLGTGFIALSFLFFDMYMIISDLPGVFGDSSTGVLIAGGYLFILLFHLASFWLLFHHRMTFRNYSRFALFLLCLGIVSIFTVAMEKVMFDEIAHQMPFWRASGIAAVAGFPSVIKALAFVLMGEFLMLAGGYTVNILFTVLMLSFLLKVLKHKGYEPVDRSMREDILFTSAHGMGTVTGLLGLFLSLTVILNETPVSRFWVSIPFYILFTLPYMVTAALWVSVKCTHDITRWYDEKQWHDMLKSSLTTLLISVPGLAILLLFPKPLHFYWFPYYLSLILTLFSAGTIYFFRKA